MTMLYFFAYSCMSFVVGPSGIASARPYHFLSWDGQKYGPVKISWKQSICTPAFPAFSMNGMWASIIPFRCSSQGRSVGILFATWMRPAFTILAMGFLRDWD